MLESIHLKNVGPSPDLRLDLAPRLNLITGDNGLGKSFLLDIAWWAMTKTWAREMVVPKPRAKTKITFAFTTKSGSTHERSSRYLPNEARWSVAAFPHFIRPIPGLILYAQVDGAFSVWDPARNYATNRAAQRDVPGAFHFSAEEVWRGNAYCKGLIDDWALWQAGSNTSFGVLTSVLEALSPSEAERLVPGELRKLTVKDPQRYPTLRMPYGEDVAVIHASAGMRRVLALAYLLTWAWQEHVESAKLLRGQKPTSEIVFLIDEIEGHLHPQWQRRIVPALLNVMQALTGEHGSKVQLIAATHSPLVLASVEPSFDADADAWFDLDLDRKATPPTVTLTRRPYVRQGEIGNWLVSEAFDLKEPRSLVGEQAIRAAEALMKARTRPSVDAVKSAEAALRAAGLPDIDTFWVRWRYFRDQLLDASPKRPRR